MRNKLLRSLPEYNLGRMHYATGISDFYRLSLTGDARAAYMQGRYDAAVKPLLERIRRKA